MKELVEIKVEKLVDLELETSLDQRPTSTESMPPAKCPDLQVLVAYAYKEWELSSKYADLPLGRRCKCPDLCVDLLTFPFPSQVLLVDYFLSPHQTLLFLLSFYSVPSFIFCIVLRKQMWP